MANEPAYCGQCGNRLPPAVNFCGSCGAVVNTHHTAMPPAPVAFVRPYADAHQDEQLIRRIADYERLSAFLWMILGIVQIVTVVAIIAGVWNLFAAWSRFHLVPLIRERNQRIPSAYEGVAGLVIIGLVNLLLGGFIGVAFVIFDFIIRDKVLNNRHLFNNVPHGAEL